MVSERSFDTEYTLATRDAFWREVELSLPERSKNSAMLLMRYRRQLESAPIEEQILIYHDAPQRIALDFMEQTPHLAELHDRAERELRPLITDSGTFRAVEWLMYCAMPRRYREAIGDFADIAIEIAQREGMRAAKSWMLREALSLPRVAVVHLTNSTVLAFVRLFRSIGG